MATALQQRRVLVEIPAPQPKSAAHMRRSYLDVLNSQVGSSSHISRNSGVSASPRRNRALETYLRSTPMSRSEDVQVKQTSLSQQQVVHFIQSIILQQKQQEPTAACSDVKVLLEDLHLKKTVVYKSIPYSRLGSNRDAHCYRKAYPHLLAFKRSCQEGGRLLVKDQRWEEALEFTLGAWWCTASLPQWEIASHNIIREQCYGILADLCTTALQHYQPHHSQALELFRRFKLARVHSNLILPCIEMLERILGEEQGRMSDITSSVQSQQ